MADDDAFFASLSDQDQSRAGMESVASLMVGYFNKLVAAHMTRAEALALTVAAQTALIQANFGRGSDSS